MKVKFRFMTIGELYLEDVSPTDIISKTINHLKVSYSKLNNHEIYECSYKDQKLDIEKTYAELKINDYDTIEIISASNDIDPNIPLELNLKLRKSIVKNCSCGYWGDSKMAYFTKNNEQFLVHRSKKGNNLIISSIENEQTIQQYEKIFPTEHASNSIECIRYYKINNIDYIITSSKMCDIKLYKILEDELIELLYLKHIYNNEVIASCCLLNDFENNIIYIISSSSGYEVGGKIKIFNLKGELIKEIGDEEDIRLVDTHIKNKNIYVMIGTFSHGIKAYNFNDGSLFKQYLDTNEEKASGHYTIIFMNENEFIESTFYSSIRIWNFDNGNLIKKINSFCNNVGILLWNDNYLFTAESWGNNKIKLIDISKGEVVKIFMGHKSDVRCFLKINHPKYGESLLSCSEDGTIKLWAK